MAKTAFIGLRVPASLKKQVEDISAQEARSVSQICEMLLRAGVEGYKRSGSKYLRRHVASQEDEGQ